MHKLILVSDKSLSEERPLTSDGDTACPDEEVAVAPEVSPDCMGAVFVRLGLLFEAGAGGDAVPVK